MHKKLFFVSRNLTGGGAERVISTLASHFSQLGYKVTLICLTREEKRYTLDPEVTVTELVGRNDKTNLLSRAYYALITLFKLMQIIRKEKPECCISFMTSVNLWTGISCLLLNESYIVSERTSPYHSLGKLNFLTRWLTFKVYSKAKVVVLPSKKMVDSFRSLKQFRKLNNLVSIYNPVYVFNSPTENVIYPRPFILSVGRLVESKGFDLLIDCFNLLKDKDIDLLICGVGPYKLFLEKKIIEFGLESRVKFIGFSKNMQDYYSNANLFVSASRVEGYPNALVEAMSLGCPVVATDCDFGPSEIIENGVNGLLVKLDDKEELAHAIETLLADKQLRNSFAKNGKRIIETNSIENIAQKWNNLILS